MLSKEQKEFLLKPKSLPSTSHYMNLRNALPRSKWDKLRKMTYERANNMCELCGSSPKRLEAHELWRFVKNEKIQVLERLVCLCSRCHSLQHMNLLKLQADQGVKKFEPVLTHYNKLTTSKEIEASLLRKANEIYSQLEGTEWTVLVVKEFDDILKHI